MAEDIGVAKESSAVVEKKLQKPSDVNANFLYGIYTNQSNGTGKPDQSAENAYKQLGNS